MVDVPVPEIGPDDVLIQVKAMSICGTDLHIHRWDPWAAEHVKVPVTVGHELCGTVEKRGDAVSEPAIGDVVSVESHIVCNRCSWCRTGRGHLCENTELLGIDRDGAYAEYVAVPAGNAWPNSPDMPYSIAALQENFGNAVHTASTPTVAGKKVLVTGVGPVGLMTLATALALGARAVYATDVSDYRLELAEKMGASLALNAADDGVAEAILAETSGEGVDVLLEMSGAPSAIDTGFGLLKAGGEAALLGLTSNPIEFNLDDHVIFKGATVHGIFGRKLWETWYQARGLMGSGAIDLNPVITHRFAFGDYEKAFALMHSGQCGKIVMFPDPADADGPLS
jgi:threonine 3-dehydrogenase